MIPAQQPPQNTAASKPSLFRRIIGLYRYETVRYVFYGGLTTVLNLLVYHILKQELAWVTWLSNAAAWIISVLFAFFVNRFFVFRRKKGSEKYAFFLELAAFAGSRLFSGLTEEFLVIWWIDFLYWPDLPVKIGVGVLVLIVNYLFSKFLIFRKAKLENNKDNQSSE